MITEDDLNAAIAECKGRRNPDASTCIKLAAFYTIRREMFGGDYSFAPAPVQNTIEIDSDTEFARTVNGMAPWVLLPVVDELMSTLKIIQPRLYTAVMDKLN